MTNPEIIDAYWGGWETCVSELTKQFETIKTGVRNDSEAADNPEALDFLVDHLEKSIGVVQSFSGMRERVDATMKEEQQTEQ